ncbi:hypothetical protein FE257_006930 [Aspergillus nanangensis]|uniref:Uncharacterized protein n=1 Tax=Aspergillus nanangensis TaxID=2582783 RepID=A0AAD4GUN1_ASPNN|nr:hypothetical protein FE257_006930 [Aspergillus nanangensis]
MDVDSANSEFIHTGVWTDWSYGRIHGATLTLSAQNAGFLTAFLALFVTISAGHLWRIITFTIHQLHTSQKPKDALHHQQQVAFRNTTSPTSLIWDFTLLAWAWRTNARRSFMRNVPFILLAIVWLALAGSAAILSARITEPPGNDCLIMSPNCGVWSEVSGSNTSDPNVLDMFGAVQLLATNTATQYARTCYNNDTQNLPQCNVYTKPRLPVYTTANASCPFNTSICLEGATAAFTMDTGLLDTREHLGINTPDDDRMLFRKVVTCAPLVRVPYITVHNDSNPLPDYPFENYTLAAYHYGDSSDGEGFVNYTYKYDIVTSRALFAYMIHASWAFAGASKIEQSWKPRAELNRTDADVSIFFLNANNVMYEYPTDDPMFSAHRSALDELSAIPGANATIAAIDNWYSPDTPTTMLGCVDQFQLCNARTGTCSNPHGVQPFMDVASLTSLVNSLGLSLLQSDVFAMLVNYLTLNNMYHSIYGRSSYALRAQETLADLNQMAPLPANQWHIEVQAWFETNLAKLQERSVEFATGPRQLREKRQRVMLTDLSPLCGAQKVRCPAGNISFSVLGMAGIVAVGGVVIMANLVVDMVIGWVSRRWFPGNLYRRLNWALDEKLQLQRMAFEGVGAGHWDGRTAAVPVTDRGEMFGSWADFGERHVLLEKVEGSTPENGGLLAVGQA